MDEIFMEQRMQEDSDEPREPYLEELEFDDPLPFDHDFSIVSNILPSKTNVTLLATRIAIQVSEGHVDPIEAAIRLNAMKGVCEEALAAIREDVLEELGKSAGKASKHDCKVERAEVGTKYDYSASADWHNFKLTEEEAAIERKKVEERLKRIPPGKLQVDQETGETLTGPAKVSTTSFKVTLAK